MTMSNPTLIRVITWLPVGGIERRLVAVAPRLRDKGWNVRVVCIREEGPLGQQLRDQNIPLDVFPFHSRLSPPGIWKLARYFRQHKAQVVHCHMYRSNIPGSLAAALAGVPVRMAQIHNVDSWDNPRQILTDRLSCRFRTGTFAVSRAVQRDVMKKLGVPEQKVPILYNGVDVTQFIENQEARRSVREELGIPNEGLLFLIPARLHPQKNPLGVLDAICKILGKYPQQKIYFAFAGKGKLEDELKEAIKNRRVSEKILMLGTRDDMVAIYNATDAVILSSFKEGFSNAVIEALACGKPVIASDVGGNKEAISDRKYGWIHQAGDGEALVQQLSEACDLGLEGLEKMALDCRARAEVFSLDALIENTHKFYCQALGVSF